MPFICKYVTNTYLGSSINWHFEGLTKMFWLPFPNRIHWNYQILFLLMHSCSSSLGHNFIHVDKLFWNMNIWNLIWKGFVCLISGRFQRKISTFMKKKKKGRGNMQGVKIKPFSTFISILLHLYFDLKFRKWHFKTPFKVHQTYILHTKSLETRVSEFFMFRLWLFWRHHYAWLLLYCIIQYD